MNTFIKEFTILSRFTSFNLWNNYTRFLIILLLSCITLANPVFALTTGKPGDLNGDGRSDLIFQDKDGLVNAWQMRPDGLAPEATAVLRQPGPGWRVIHTADLNGDGKADIIWEHDDGRVAIFIMNGLTIAARNDAIMGAGQGWQVTHVGDLNGDGKADLLWRNTNGSIVAWLMDGLNIIGGAAFAGPGNQWEITHLADMNGDGKVDFLWQHPDGSVAAWLMDGLTSVGSTGFQAAGAQWKISHTADFNGDGKADLIWKHADGSVAVWLMNGLIGVDGAMLMGAGTGWSVSHTPDLNGDGKADLIWKHTDGSAVTWLMNGTAYLSGHGFAGPGAVWAITHTADLNGDGKSDLLWRHPDGSIVTWLMNGGTVIGSNYFVGGAPEWRAVPAVATHSPPMVYFVAPQANQTFSAPAQITLRATAVDLEKENPVKVEFFYGTTQIGSTLTAPNDGGAYRVDWSGVGAGTYILRVRATDAKGAFAEHLVSVTIANPAPTPIGELDSVSATSAFGWACLRGDSNTKLNVYAGLWDGFNWLSLAWLPADKQRIDVGNSGKCGQAGDIESHYHGFEWPIFIPDWADIKNKYVDLFVYVPVGSASDFQLIGSRRLSYFEAGLPTSQIWRTDYDEPTLRQPALVSCVWPFHGANQRTNTTNTPQHPFTRPTIGGGGTPGGANFDEHGTIVAGLYGTVGFTTPNIFCINYDAASAIPAPWNAANAAAGNPSGVIWPTRSNGQAVWPTSNYWVVHANSEMAFQLTDQPNAVSPNSGWKASSGPPSQSEPVTGGLYEVTASSAGFALSVDNTDARHNGKLSWLSIGAQMERGAGGALAFVEPVGPETFLEFDIQKTVDTDPSNYRAVNVFIEAIFGGAKRQIWITLQQPISGRYHWNWNVAQSFFYPGADLNLYTPSEILACAGLPPSTHIPEFGGAGESAGRSYSIPIRAIFNCLDGLQSSSPRYWGSSPLGYNRPMLISGVHIGIETGPSPATKLGVAFTTPKFVKR